MKPSINILKIESIKEQSVGISKYQLLRECNEGYDIPSYREVPQKLMEHYRQSSIDEIGCTIPVEICSI